MSDLTDLYQEVILDHNKRPRNFGAMAEFDRRALGHNPLCGDRLVLYLKLNGDRVAGVSFEGSGCAISKASASLMTDAIKGKTIAEVRDLFTRFQAMVTLPLDQEIDSEGMGKLAALGGVRTFPVRIKCASLAWHTLKAALDQSQAPAHTE
jgi:nitrogen fixation NifU-like protein